MIVSSHAQYNALVACVQIKSEYSSMAGKFQRRPSLQASRPKARIAVASHAKYNARGSKHSCTSQLQSYSCLWLRN
eukprot:1066303-Pleurochrysis_carterae.AAC.1